MKVLLLPMLVVLAGCTSSYAARPLPADHPANPRAEQAAFSMPMNPLTMAAEHPMSAPAAKMVVGDGKIIAVVPNSDQIVVDHAKIEGFMDAMTMGYKVSPPSLMEGLKAGDQIRFTIDTAAKSIVKIEKKN